MRLWIRHTGKDYDDFWRRTPAEFNLIVAAHSEKTRDEHRARMAEAYATGVLVHAAFNNPKKFPKAEHFLRENKRRVVKTLAEQRAALDAIAKRVN